jgi:hypothetical protein
MPGGPIITVERHLLIVFFGAIAASLSYSLGHVRVGQALFAGLISFTIGIKTMIWLLMHWK